MFLNACIYLYQQKQLVVDILFFIVEFFVSDRGSVAGSDDALRAAPAADCRVCHSDRGSSGGLHPVWHLSFTHYHSVCGVSPRSSRHS